MKRIFIGLSLFLLSGFSIAEAELSLPTDIEPFFVHRTLNDAWGRKTQFGVYCYAVEQKGVREPFVQIYIVSGEEVIDYVSQGSNGKELMERIRNIRLNSFDYKVEVKKTIEQLTKLYKKKGRTYYPPMVRDGQYYEITYNLDNTKVEVEAWNPGYTIYEFSEHNENIGKLYAVYKELMIYYAQRKFNFK